MVPIASGSSKSPPVAIAYSRGAGWRRFTVWVARRDGSVAALCPLVPKNAKIDKDELVRVYHGREEEGMWGGDRLHKSPGDVLPYPDLKTES